MLHVLMLLVNAHRLIMLMLHPFRRCTELHFLHLVAATSVIIDISMSKIVFNAALNHISYGSWLHLGSVICQCGKLVYVKSERERHGRHAFVVFFLTRGTSIIYLLHLDVVSDISCALAISVRCKCRVALCPAISVVKYDMGWSLEYFLEDSFG